jgi:tRNA-binding protein
VRLHQSTGARFAGMSGGHELPIKPTADFSHFDALDIRVGRIVKVEEAQTKKPTWRMTIDFGGDIGTKVSCGAYRHYAKEDLIGRQVLAVVNFAPRKMGPEISEVLTLGVPGEQGATIYVTPQQEVELGAALF